MSTIAPRDQFKPMRIGENLVVNYNLRYFSREMGQFQSPWVRFRKDKPMRPHVNMSTPCGHVNISPCLWLQLVTEVHLGIRNRDKFKLNIDRSVKTPWQEYPGIVAGSWWWAPGNRQALIDRTHKSTSLQAVRFCIHNKISPILYLHNTIRPS